MVGTPDDDALAGLFFRPDLGSRSPTVVVKNSPTGHVLAREMVTGQIARGHGLLFFHITIPVNWNSDVLLP
jgi:hypothetical protein